MSVKIKNRFSENDENLAEMWPLIISEKRWEAQGPVIMRLIKQSISSSRSQIVDLCGALGTEVINICEALREEELSGKFDVICNEFSPPFYKKARKEILKRGYPVNFTKDNWLDLSTLCELPNVALLLCIGNSFCSLEKTAERKRAIENFYSTLNEDGVLVIDERNPSVIEVAKSILEKGETLSNKNFDYTSLPMYSSEIKVEPISVDDESYTYEYSGILGGKVSNARLKMYRLAIGEIRDLLIRAGFESVVSLSDWKTYLPESDKTLNHNFEQHIAFKNPEKAAKFKEWFSMFSESSTKPDA